jgi:CheY-like chemotaxis protein
VAGNNTRLEEVDGNSGDAGNRQLPSRELGASLLTRTGQSIRHSNDPMLPDNGSELGANKLRVLVVEDERDTLLTFAELFTLFGHDVSFARTPALAIAESLTKLPEVVISDVGLPGMDGCELAKELRAVAASISGSRPLLVAMTGLGDEARERCLAAGFDHFFTKPADTEALERLLLQFAVSRSSATPSAGDQLPDCHALTAG